MINTNFSCYFSSSLSRSDDNRRAAGDFANLIVWCHPSNVLSSIVSARLTSLVSCPLPSSRGSAMASSFRMMLFPPREAMTTAEQTEILPISSSGVIRLTSYHLSSPLVSCLTSLVSCPLPSSRGSAMATSFLMTSFALAKRLQPPSRRSRCFFSIQNSFYSNKFFSGLTVGGEAFSVIRVFCGF